MRTIKQTAVIIIIGCIFGLLFNAFSGHPLPFVPEPIDPERWPVLTVDDVQRYIDEGLGILIDARDAKYFELGHIPGAINLSAKTFGEAFSEIGSSLPPDFPLIVYCQGGTCSESHDVLEHLEELEFHSLFIYTGGWEEWIAKNLPIEKSE